jgi:hypothetical protein
MVARLITGGRPPAAPPGTVATGPPAGSHWTQPRTGTQERWRQHSSLEQPQQNVKEASHIMTSSEDGQNVVGPSESCGTGVGRRSLSSMKIEWLAVSPTFRP